MTISYPRTNILTAANFTDQVFKLMSRQEYSRQASGAIRAKDMGPALWYAEWSTAPMFNDDAVTYEAIINSLNGAMHTFYAGDMRRQYPQAYPTGVFSDSGLISSASGNVITLKSLPSTFKLSVGDYFCFDYGTSSRALHQVMEAVTASGGITPAFEVRPYIRAGANVNIPVTFKKPTAEFVMDPSSFDPRVSNILTSMSSFKAIQYI